MINGWLNHILHLSSYIYKKKTELLTKPVFRCVTNSIVIIFLEIYLAIISLPIFFFVSEKHIKSKYRTEETGGHRFSLANIIIIAGILLLAVSFYNIYGLFPWAIIALIIVELFLFFLYSIYSKIWTEMTFKVSSYLFSQKQKLIESTRKIQSIILSIYIVILEFFLLLISLPVYVCIKHENLQKTEGEQFKLRRKMTLVYTGFFALIILLQVTIAMIIIYGLYPPKAVSFN